MLRIDMLPRLNTLKPPVRNRITALALIAYLYCPSLLFAQAQAVAPPAWVEAVLFSGQAPHQIAFSSDGQTTYVAGSGSDRIDYYETLAGRWHSAFPAAGAPLGIAASSNGELIVSRFRAAELETFNAHGESLGQLAIGAAPSLFSKVPGRKQRWLISSEKSHQLSLIEYQENDGWQLVRSFPSGQRPFPSTATEDGQRAFVPNYDDGTVSVFDLNHGTLLKTISVGKKPSGGAILPGQGRYAVAVRGENRIALIDTSRLEVVGEIQQGIGDSPFSLVVDSQGQRAYVNNTASHDISIIDLQQMAVVQRLAVGEIPIVIALQPDGQRLWVACEGSHDLYLVNLGTRPAMAHATERTMDSTHNSASEGDLRETARQEIRQLHFFFQEWFNARLPQDEASFQRFRQAMAADLSFVAPSANVLNREQLVQALWQAHGRELQDGGSRIWTDNEQLRPLDASTNGLWLGVYDEHQLKQGHHSIRRSTVILRQQADTPLGWQWHHVHETWLQQ